MDMEKYLSDEMLAFMNISTAETIKKMVETAEKDAKFFNNGLDYYFCGTKLA